MEAVNFSLKLRVASQLKNTISEYFIQPVKQTKNMLMVSGEIDDHYLLTNHPAELKTRSLYNIFFKWRDLNRNFIIKVVLFLIIKF